jgi:subtilisin family serine protease
MMPRRKITSAALTLVLLACVTGVSSAPFASASVPAAAAGKEKVGPDLKKKARDAGLYDEVDVIIQPVGAWTAELDADLNGKGAIKRAALRNFTFRAVRMRARDVESIAARTDVAYVSLDREVGSLGHVSLTSGADAARSLGGTTSYTGAGIGIAFVDSGLYASHLNFRDTQGVIRNVVSVDFTGESRTDDVYGHGSHVATLALGGNSIGLGAYRGVAPDAKIISLRVLNSQGRGTTAGLLAALDWIKTNRVAHNIRVANLSLGAVAVDSYKYDPLCRAARALVDAGVVVVAAAGNEGKDDSGRKIYGRIHSPAIDPSVITVGATNTYGTDYRLDDVVTTYSSRGPTRGYWKDSAGVKHYDNLVKPDLVAPGNRLIAAQSPSNALVTESPHLDANVSNQITKEQMYLSGTSMATPIVSGAAALMLQANPSLTPNLVKMILMYTAQQLPGFNILEQGAGQLNVEGAVRLAKLVRTNLSATTPLGDTLLTAPAPTPQTSIGGHTFVWSQGVIMGQSFATGANLILKYQKVYGLGALLGDGLAVSADGNPTSNSVVLSDGVVLSDTLLVSNGVVLSDGSAFLSCRVLLGDGVVLSDGVILSDGVVLSDGVIVSDGTNLSGLYAMVSSAMLYGDVTASMTATLDAPPAAPTSLAGAAISTTQINLTWAGNSTNEDGFAVERCMGATCTNFKQIATVGVNVYAFSNSGLTRNTTYRFRVRALSTSGNSGYSSIVTVTTKR